MKNRIIIIGVGGQGKVCADIAYKMGYKDICFADDRVSGQCLGFPIISKTDNLKSFDDGQTDFFIGVGDNRTRERIAGAIDVNWATLIHPSAQIGLSVQIGKGTVVMAGAVINSGAKIGNQSIINSCAVVEHDNLIGNFVHVSPNVSLGGKVSVGDFSHVGIGAVVKNNISICQNSIIGAGAVVVKNIEISGTYVGVPTRIMK